MSFRITDRDVRLLAAIARFRFLSTAQLRGIDGGSERGVRNRLLHLSRANYLVRTQTHVTETFAYGLGNAGARLLATHGHAVNLRLDWRDKNDRTRFFLAHTLAIADVMLHVERAALGIAQLLDQHQLMSGLASASRGDVESAALRVSVSHRDRPVVIPIIPDRVFALTYPDATAHHFALELDRGTMDIWSNHLAGKASIRRKLIGYAAAREQRMFNDRWTCKSLRVLMVTTSDQRIEHMLAAQRRAVPHCPAGFFLYTTVDRIKQHGALAPIWITTKAGRVSIAHRMSGPRDLTVPRCQQ